MRCVVQAAGRAGIRKMTRCNKMSPARRVHTDGRCSWKERPVWCCGPHIWAGVVGVVGAMFHFRRTAALPERKSSMISPHRVARLQSIQPVSPASPDVFNITATEQLQLTRLMRLTTLPAMCVCGCLPTKSPVITLQMNKIIMSVKYYQEDRLQRHVYTRMPLPLFTT